MSGYYNSHRHPQYGNQPSNPGTQYYPGGARGRGRGRGRGKGDMQWRGHYIIQPNGPVHRHDPVIYAPQDHYAWPATSYDGLENMPPPPPPMGYVHHHPPPLREFAPLAGHYAHRLPAGPENGYLPVEMYPRTHAPELTPGLYHEVQPFGFATEQEVIQSPAYPSGDQLVRSDKGEEPEQETGEAGQEGCEAGVKVKSDEAAAGQEEVTSTNIAFTSSDIVYNPPNKAPPSSSSTITKTPAISHKVEKMPLHDSPALSPSSLPGDSQSLKRIAPVPPENDSDPKSYMETPKIFARSKEAHIPASQAATLVNEALPRMCNLAAMNCAELRSTLEKAYTNNRSQQTSAATYKQTLTDKLMASNERERTAETQVFRHYDRFVRKMEEAQTAMNDAHKTAMHQDAIKSIRAAQEQGEVARLNRVESEKLLEKMRSWDKYQMTFEQDLVDMLYAAVGHALERSEMVRAEEGAGKEASG
ncbi:hypothetical protein DDE82_003669 [Stemphylium lycopersici]|nr:hypothetical protein DDE82_003669 [Stemphylium lycopersici]